MMFMSALSQQKNGSRRSFRSVLPLFLCLLCLFSSSWMVGCPNPVSPEPQQENPSREQGRETTPDAGKEPTQEPIREPVTDVVDAGPDSIPEDPTPDKEFGLKVRKANTTCKLEGEPDTVEPMQVVEAFPNLRFTQPLYITAAPDGKNRLYVVEKTGRIYLFDNNKNTSAKTLFFDISSRIYTRSESGLLGLAFHPNFKSNRTFYVHYSIARPQQSIIASFKVDPRNPDKVDMNSEVILLRIDQPYPNHNGGMIEFGKDGYLYIGMGDGGSANDPLGHGQNLNTWLGAMLRIDVDRKENGKNYGIPKDNPFVDKAGVKPEIWAYGLRNPWRFSFDRLTGHLWAGDVGQGAREEIDLIEKGGNYGWNIMEGNNCFRPSTNCNKKNLKLPVIDHNRADARSITGGYVYRGKKFPSLYGSYIYGDYVTGKIWGLRYDGQKVSKHGLLVSTSRKPTSFGEDQDGELYFVDIAQGKVYTLAQRGAQSSKFPRKLSQTGCFKDLKKLQVVDGVIPYGVNNPLWSDSLDKQRWIALPGLEKITFSTHGAWKFPAGTVFIKHFSWNLKKGDDSSRRHVETRFFVKQGNEWKGYTYLWNDEQTDAILMDNSLVKTFVQTDPQNPQNKTTLHHTLPSRADCLSCHTNAAGRVLGVTTRQINGNFDYGGITDNQLRTWNHIGMFASVLPKLPSELPRLVSLRDSQATLTQKARSYLDANCSSCHRPGVTGTANTNLLFATAFNDTKTCNAVPDKGNLGVANARIITPGKPELSLLYLRMNRRGKDQMPNLGTSLVHKEATEVIRQWILGLQGCP